VGVVLGPEGRQGGRVDLAAGRNRLGQALKVPLEAGGGVHLHEPRHGGVAWVGEGMGDPVGKQSEAAGWGSELSLLHGEHDRALHDVDGVVQLLRLAADPGDAEAEGGRGLAVVSSWLLPGGVHHPPEGGKIIWCVLERWPAPGPAASSLSELDGWALCYPAFPRLALIHERHRDG
jgi:hypothetical protein